MLQDDPRFAGVGIYIAQYHTQIDSGDYAISQCTNEIFRDLTFQSDGGTVPLSSRQIIFICHSLGGILIRRLLEIHKAIFINRSIGLILMGSPSIGSDYANMFKYVSWAYGNRIGSQLKKNSSILEDLDSRFRTMIHKNELPGLMGIELVEHHGMVRYKWLPFLRLKPVVTIESAARYFGEACLIPETNHSTLVKPETIESPAYVHLLRFYLEKFQHSTNKINSDAETSSPQDSIDRNKRVFRANVLFDIYSEKVSEYYFLRGIDGNLSNNIGLWSLWLHGESGVGKTSAVKRLIGNLGTSPVYVDMGGILEISPINFKRNLIETVANVCDVNLSNEASISDIATALNRKCTSNFELSIFIDEVPISSNASHGREIVNFVESLISSLRVKSGNLTRVIVCSINEPSTELFSKKGREQINIIKLEYWSNEEMLGLSKLLVNFLNIKSHSESEVHQLLSSAGGSPRFLKTFYKNYISLIDSGCESSFTVALQKAVDSRVGNKND